MKCQNRVPTRKELRIYGLRLTRCRVRRWHRCEKCAMEHTAVVMWTYTEAYQFTTKGGFTTIWPRKYICAECAPNRDTLVAWFEKRNLYPNWKNQGS